MRALALFLALGSGAPSAAGWQTASSLPDTHVASAAERAAIVAALGNNLVAYNFEGDSTIRIHEGDLHIEGNLDNDALLVVRGNLVVDGMYDDYRSDIGVLVVLGDMQVRDVYSWGAMYVQGDLAATGLLMTVYNDFTFEVDGKLDARALVVSDKSADYNDGAIGMAWTDDRDEADIARALRTLQPELFTRPAHLELDEDSDAYSFEFDEEYARDRLAAGDTVFRPEPADEALLQWAEAAIDPATSTGDLDALIGKDALIDQLIAARPELPRALATRLLAGGDHVVLGWLGQTAPQVVLAADAKAMTPDAAAALVGHADTTEVDLQRIAAHADPQVRIVLAERPELSATLINRLAADTHAAVRAAVIGAYFNALELEPDVLKARLADDAQPVRDALAGARLDANQARALLPGLSEQGLRDFARLLREQARGARPTALDAAGIVAVADAVLARKQHDAATDAFMSLPAATQLERLDAMVEAKSLDLAQMLEHSPHAALIQRIVAIADALGAPLPYQLARNPHLPAVLQLDLVSRAAKATPDPDDYSMDTPDEVLSELLGNDAASDEAVLAATNLALERGINPFDGGMQNALFHHRNLPPVAIAKLDHELRGGEDWSLQLLLQRRATAEQVDRALRRWYDDRPEIIDELRRIEAKQVDDYFAALATAKHTELREVAAWNLATPVTALVALVGDPEAAVAGAAAMHPALPEATRLQVVQRAPADAYANFELPAAQWDALAASLPTRETRIAAMAQAARVRERELATR